MASVLAIVSKAVFEKAAPDARLGQVLDMSYASANKALATLSEGGALFLVTVRPPDERLWLVAVLESPKLTKDAWRAANTTPITDVTSVLPVLELESGVGVTFKPGALGMTLQSPRRLAEAGADRLRALGGGKASKPAAISRAASKVDKPGKPAKPAKGDIADLARALGVKGARVYPGEMLALDAHQWVAYASEIAALGRVRKLKLHKASGRDLEAALDRPELAQMTALSLLRNRLLEPEANAIANSPYLTAIESLDLGHSSVSGKSFARMLAMRAPALRRLDLEGNKVGAVGVRALAKAPIAQQLTHLNLLYNQCGDEALAELLGSPAMRNLEEIDVHREDTGPMSRDALLANPLASRLVVIALDGVKELLAKNRQAKRKWTAPPEASITASPPVPAKRPTAKRDDRGEDLVARLAGSFDTATRSVYVDWLLERGDPRGELAMLDAQWVATNGEDKTTGKLFRLRSKLAKEFAAQYRFKSAALGYAHGLLVEVEGPAKFFIDNGAELFANEPIRSVALSRATVKDLTKLAAVPGIQRMSWLSLAADLVEPALALFSNVAIDLREPDDDDIDHVFALAGSQRVRGITLSFPKKEEITRLAKTKALAKLARLDIDDFICSTVFPEYREESDATAILKLGWKLVWVSTRIVTPRNLAKLRARVTDVVIRYD